MKRLDGKVAVITGAARGIGYAAAKIFLAEGAKLLLVDILEKELSQAVKSLSQSKEVDSIVADLSTPEGNQAFVEKALSRFGKIDVFLANAGIVGQLHPIQDYPVEAFDKVISINVRGTWLGLKYVIPAMQKAGGGSIVITSSMAGVAGAPGWSAYDASKHALIGIMRTAALEAGPMGIRVNTVNPGPVETDMLQSMGKMSGAPDQFAQGMVAMVPLKRSAQPEEIAWLMLFLASDESSYCTGGVYMVDGGLTAS
jgi:NAD(P)-dependent dehydrogenase (short-subunit alcohol dehydrogenase family)